MTESMVERVARAIYERPTTLQKYGRDWDQLPEMHPRKSQCRKDARAAIAEMREPTEAMHIAGLHAKPGVKPVWHAMIDAAL